MILKLPHIEAIDTLNLPKDFEEKIKESFGKFTEYTSKDYTFKDKLAYLDNLRSCFLHPGDAETGVKELIKGYVDYQLDNVGDYPDKDEFWSFEFMCECYNAGNKNFRAEYENSHHRNDKTHKAILEIIRIIVNWSDSNDQL